MYRNQAVCSSSNPVHTYNNGQPYRTAIGRAGDLPAVEYRTFNGHPIIRGCPTQSEFLRAVKRELKIRGYRRSTIKNYTNKVAAFLRWFGAKPNRVAIEDVRNYLEILVDGGADTSTVSGNLSAIRTCFDKFCGRDVTLGLATPRRRKSQPVILSPTEVSRIIDAAPTFSMKLVIGIMYAAGLRNSEICRLQVWDLDFARGTIRVYQGKGQTDRLVMMPKTFRKALLAISHERTASAYLFPSLQGRCNRYMSPRTLQRWVKVCVELAGIKRRVTPHSFRHAFATHLLENGTDIRFIQKLLGHRRLETTTIYTRVAQIKSQKIASPLDRLADQAQTSSPTPTPTPTLTPARQGSSPSVGKLSIDVRLRADQKSANANVTIAGDVPIPLPGISVHQNEQGWLELCLPPVDHWRTQLDRLTKVQRERIESPEFYELLRHHICQRFLAQRGST